MSFFEPPPPRPEPEPQAMPAWFGPPSNVLGGAISLHIVLARTDDVAVAITNGAGYPTGFELTLTLRRRREAGFLDPFTWHYVHARSDRPELPDEAFRFGIQFADGRKATNVGTPWPEDPENAPEGPVLVPHGGGGGGHTFRQELWVWPLPPAGPLALVCEWPSEGLGITRVEIDAELVLDAARRAEILWEDGEPEVGGASSFLRIC
jgi:hypothetical protein